MGWGWHTVSIARPLVRKSAQGLEVMFLQRATWKPSPGDCSECQTEAFSMCTRSEIPQIPHLSPKAQAPQLQYQQPDGPVWGHGTRPGAELQASCPAGGKKGSES